MALGGDDAGGSVGEALAAQEGGQRVAGIGAAAVQVALAPDEQAQALGEGGGARGQRDAWGALAEPGESRAEHDLHPHRGRGDAEAAGAPGERGVELLLGCLDLAQDAARERRGGVAERVGRTPVDRRSNRRPPKRASRRAMARVSAGWEMARRSAAARIFCGFSPT